jgi:hypothetical protein
LNNNKNYFSLYRDIFDILTNYYNLGRKVYFLKTKSKLNFKVFKEDLIIDENINNFILNEKVKKLKEVYSYDLFVLDSIRNLNFLIVVPKLENNLFKYEITLCQELDIYNRYFEKYDEFLEDIILKPVNIVKINEVYNNFNLSIDLIEKTFNFENRIFKEVDFLEEEYSQ